MSPLIFEPVPNDRSAFGRAALSGLQMQAARCAAELAETGQAIGLFVDADRPDRDHLVAVFDTSKIGPSRLHDAQYIMCAVVPDSEWRIRHFGEAFGWSSSVCRAVHALYESCDMDVAAAQIGISVHTLREQIETARNAVGAVNVSMLFMTLTVMAMPTGERGPETDLLVRQAYDLTERQFRIASRVANGSSRPEVAEKLGVSLALVNKELGAAFSVMHVASILALTRVFAEARMIAMGSYFGASLADFLPPSSRTLSFRAADGQRMVLSDYGPVAAAPVFVLHPSVTTRPVNCQLVEALQNAGFRPLAPIPSVQIRKAIPPRSTPGLAT